MNQRNRFIIIGGMLVLLLLCVFVFFSSDKSPIDESVSNEKAHGQKSDRRSSELVEGVPFSSKSQIRIEHDVSLEEAAPEPLYSTTVHAEVKFGETLAIGGWGSEEESYMFIFSTPESFDGNVRFSTKYVKIHSAESVESLKELQSLLTVEKHSDQNGETWLTEDLPKFMRKVAQMKGTDIVTSPTIVTRDGQQGVVTVGSLSLSLEATLLEDGSGYDMKLESTLNESMEE